MKYANAVIFDESEMIEYVELRGGRALSRRVVSRKLFYVN